MCAIAIGVVGFLKYTKHMQKLEHAEKSKVLELTVLAKRLLLKHGGGIILLGAGGIGFIIIIGGGGPRIGGGGGILPPPMPGTKSFASSSGNKSVKSRSQSVNGLTILFRMPSQCSSFSDFFGSGFLIS